MCQPVSVRHTLTDQTEATFASEGLPPRQTQASKDLSQTIPTAARRLLVSTKPSFAVHLGPSLMLRQTLSVHRIERRQQEEGIKL